MEATDTGTGCPRKQEELLIQSGVHGIHDYSCPSWELSTCQVPCQALYFNEPTYFAEQLCEESVHIPNLQTSKQRPRDGRSLSQCHTAHLCLH